ncbi:unnamed protein product [Eruca vesicaria subsp. sativa]|uniref:F-box domain-containing protein n=1 Tax=Eruca vesicaria subsp. sativa TaxID=29727 RepID=A0ABC8K7R7_ERUVS|nr:unnamed protein product [Eruca vesicaria subsp. sativa]
MAAMNLQVEQPGSKTETSQPPLCPSFSLLPDEIVVRCLARISRMYYPTLSIISKNFRALLSSKELYAARSHVGSTEECLYVCLSDDTYQSPQWFTLWINPNGTLPNSTIKEKKKSLAPIPSSDFPSVTESTLVVGSEIYVIGGPIKTEPSCPSSAVRILDCRTHTWRDAPSMILARNHALTCFYDGKIYVMGGCGVLEEPWAEVFDTNTQTCEPISDPGTEIRKGYRCNLSTIKEIKGKIYYWDSKTYAYDTRHGTWESFVGLWESTTCLIDGGVQYYYIPKSACVMDGVWYYINRNPLTCCWTKDGEHWKVVKGLDSLREMYNRKGGACRTTAKLVSCGGKLLLLWEGSMTLIPSKRKKIWCAEITLETNDEGDVWGNVEGIDVVQRVPTQCELLHCRSRCLGLIDFYLRYVRSD